MCFEQAFDGAGNVGVVSPTIQVRLIPGTVDYSEFPSTLIFVGYYLTLFIKQEVNQKTAFMELTKGAQQ